MKIGHHEIKAAIFDVDGTILDSMPYWINAADEYLDRLNIPHAEGVGKMFLSMNMEEGAEYLRQKYLPDMSMRQLLGGIVDVMTEAYTYKVQPKPGAIEFMRTLRDNGIPIVIATATDRRMLQAGLDRLGISELIQTILTCSECQTSKSKPDIFLRAAELLGTQPNETVVFEDALYAVTTAVNAGFVVVAMHDAASVHNADQIENIAAYYIEDFAQIADLEQKEIQ